LISEEAQFAPATPQTFSDGCDTLLVACVTYHGFKPSNETTNHQMKELIVVCSEISSHKTSFN
jgi:hypothetical protein